MPRNVLIEAHAIMLKQGTGIATYARNVTSAASGLGHNVELLIGLEQKIDRQEALLAEVELYDVEMKGPQRLRDLSRAVSWTIGFPGGIGTQTVPNPRIVLDPKTGSPIERRHPTIGALRLWENAFLHFNRFGRRLKILTSRQTDLFHVTRPTPAYVKGAANIYTIHDIVPLRLPYTTLDNKRYYFKSIQEIIKKADHIITVSDHTKHDIQEFFDIEEDRITTTWQSVAVPDYIISMSDADIARDIENRYGLVFQEYFLFLGAVEPKKNISRMVEAYVASGVAKPLVLVGGLGWQYDRDLEIMDDELFRSWRFDGSHIRVERRVQRLPYVPQATLFALIRGARAVILPSLYEGFGLPILEAMQLGTPVITSTASSLPEVAGDAAVLVDPYRIDSIRDAIRTIDADADLRSALIARGHKRAEFFSPERHEERLRAVYSKYIG